MRNIIFPNGNCEICALASELETRSIIQAVGTRVMYWEILVVSFSHSLIFLCHLNVTSTVMQIKLPSYNITFSTCILKEIHKQYYWNNWLNESTKFSVLPNVRHRKVQIQIPGRKLGIYWTPSSDKYFYNIKFTRCNLLNMRFHVLKCDSAN